VRGGLVDPLVDAAHLALRDLPHEPGRHQPLHVVVDPLRGLVQLCGDLGARPWLGELAQHLDPGRLEQCLGLLDVIQVDHVPHENSVVRKN
jgi:hypothetical protein